MEQLKWNCIMCGSAFKHSYGNQNLLKTVYGGLYCPKCKKERKAEIRTKCWICGSDLHSTFSHLNRKCVECGANMSFKDLYRGHNICKKCRTESESPNSALRTCIKCGRNTNITVGNICYKCQGIGCVETYTLGKVAHIKTFRPFSVEIEAVRKYKDVVLPYELSKLKQWFHENVDKRCNVGTDGSVCSTQNNIGHEFRLGIFRNDTGLSKIKRIVKEIRRVGYRSNNTCGMHVHVDVHDYVADKFDFTKTFPAFRAFEPVLFNLVNPARLTNRYCHKFGACGSGDSNVNRFDQHNRYYAINFAAINKYGSLEYRLFGGSTHPNRVVFYVYLAVRLTDWILKNHNFRGKISIEKALSLDEKYVKYANTIQAKQKEKRDILGIEYPNLTVQSEVNIGDVIIAPVAVHSTDINN